MDMQEYIRVNIVGKGTVILVCGAKFEKDHSDLIDSHDIVFRFNLFNDKGFAQRLCGSKITYWCINARTNPTERRGRDPHCEIVRRVNPQVTVLTPFSHVSEDLKSYFQTKELPLVFAAKELEHDWFQRLKPSKASTGLYMACRLLQENVPIATIGFTGGVTPKHHAGPREVELLRSHPLVTFHGME